MLLIYIVMGSVWVTALQSDHFKFAFLKNKKFFFLIKKKKLSHFWKYVLHGFLHGIHILPFELAKGLEGKSSFRHRVHSSSLLCISGFCIPKTLLPAVLVCVFIYFQTTSFFLSQQEDCLILASVTQPEA